MTDENLQGASPAEGAPVLPQDNAVPAETPAASVEKPVPDDAGNDELKGVSRRIDELTRNWREAERREKALLELLQKDRQEPAQAPPASETKPKTLADFDYDETKYQAHLFEQAEQRAVAAAERKLKESQEQETSRRRQTEFVTRERKFAEATPDYFEVTRSAALNITQSMVDAAAESEEAPALLYYLGKNPEIADRLAGLSPLATAREIGRIEARLLAERDKAKAPQVSKAPPPTPKIEGAGDPAVQKEPSEMTDAEFRKWRQRQIAQRR
jgi:hypothetical protein